MNNYTILHCHTMFGNGSFIDSTVRYEEYIDKAKEIGMTAIAITEHGSVFSWYNKKIYCEKMGLKYIHASEFYVTETLEEKIRDNYHTCLYAKNFQGFKELNRLSSLSWKRDQENRYYYNPRITLNELINTSDNIIITTACLGGILSKGNNTVKEKFIKFAVNNKHRVFLEVQPYNVDEQKEYNKYLYNLHLETGLHISVGTDFHCMDDTESRDILQRSKKIMFDNEEGWDLTFKDYPSIVKCFQIQNCIPIDEIYTALENTNLIASMVEEFKLDYTNKYPHIYDNPEEIITQKIEEGFINRGLKKEDYIERVEYELEAYRANDALQFILLDDKVKEYCRNNNIKYGYSRGSVSGSFLCYLLEITDVNPIKWNLSFERFLSADRVSLMDIDSDYPPSKRDEIKKFLYSIDSFNCCDIITHNTIALKGAIRDVGRALGISLSVIDEISKNIETDEDKYRKEYPNLFKFVDKLNGTIVSVGAHPCGTVVSDYNLDECIATFTTSSNEYPISQINMKEIDSQNFVKLDLLGLDNIELIQKTCELADIPWLNTDSIDFDDFTVWKSIKESPCMIFQWESDFAHSIYKRLFSDETLQKVKEKNPNITYLDLCSMGTGSVRPSGASYREDMCIGKFNDNKHEALNNLLADTLGNMVFQEQIIRFLNEFCGFSKGRADIVRRGFAKKTGTGEYLQEIHDGFIKFMTENYGENNEKYEDLLAYFLEVISDASLYAFSFNHALPYSMISFACAYLRHYYTLEFVCSGFNIYRGKDEKLAEISEYARKKNIKILPVKFRKSRAEYFIDKANNAIYAGVANIKNLNQTVSEELYNLREKEYNTFIDLLYDLEETSINSRQLDILIRLSYFSEFGKIADLLAIYEIFKDYVGRKTIKTESIYSEDILKIIQKNGSNVSARTRKELRSYTIHDTRQLLYDLQNYVLSNDAPDIPLVDRVAGEIEYSGSVIASGKEEDRNILFIKEVYPIRTKKDNKIFGRKIIYISIGSGVGNSMSILNRYWNKDEPIQAGDLIRCIKWTKSGQYFNMEKYEHIFK